MPIDAEAPIPDLPNNSKLRQQRLDGWQPIATPKNTVATLSAIGMAFLIIGSVLVSSNGEIEETDIRYDNIQSCKENVTSGGVVCNVTLNFNEDMKNDNGPLRFSYSLSNFFQASRRYVKSRSAWQLADVPGTTSICEPLENFDNGTKSKRLYPCGWVANSFFNDTFKGYFCPSGGQSCEILSGSAWKQSDISWESDRRLKFKNRDLKADETRTGPGGFQLPNIDNEDFIVWMRVAGLPTFRKLYSTIDRSFSKGDSVVIEINSNYPVGGFDGMKKVILEETNWMNGRNVFLGPLYLVVGCGSLLAALVFVLKQIYNPRILGDVNLLRAEFKHRDTYPK